MRCSACRLLLSDSGELRGLALPGLRQVCYFFAAGFRAVRVVFFAVVDLAALVRALVDFAAGLAVDLAAVDRLVVVFVVAFLAVPVRALVDFAAVARVVVFFMAVFFVALLAAVRVVPVLAAPDLAFVDLVAVFAVAVFFAAVLPAAFLVAVAFFAAPVFALVERVAVDFAADFAAVFALLLRADVAFFVLVFVAMSVGSCRNRIGYRFNQGRSGTLRSEPQHLFR